VINQSPLLLKFHKRWDIALSFVCSGIGRLRRTTVVGFSKEPFAATRDNGHGQDAPKVAHKDNQLPPSNVSPSSTCTQPAALFVLGSRLGTQNHSLACELVPPVPSGSS